MVVRGRLRIVGARPMRQVKPGHWSARQNWSGEELHSLERMAWLDWQPGQSWLVTVRWGRLVAMAGQSFQRLGALGRGIGGKADFARNVGARQPR